jgi:hypothetical protein
MLHLVGNIARTIAATNQGQPDRVSGINASLQSTIYEYHWSDSLTHDFGPAWWSGQSLSWGDINWGCDGQLMANAGSFQRTPVAASGA